ncbi:hypothetical protein F5I97DRAFT_1974384 [Phlebopus sp. FC_14]|nr:hypothetical protein F5I97DRAFT_1974384 [Phlebopus sp. FC_14]
MSSSVHVGPLVNGTPSRERHSSSQSTSSPMSMRPPASSSTTSLSASTNPTTQPITLEALLAQHATAPNPTLAALDQALSERNVFSTQNTQLWKLIEKQRTGYSQVLKELERIRTERDAYKGRLQAAGLSVELAKKDKEKAKALRTSASNTAISTASLNGSSDLRSTMKRHQSENSGISSSAFLPYVTSPVTHPAHPASLTPHTPSTLSSTLSPIIEDPAQVNRESKVKPSDDINPHIDNMSEDPMTNPGISRTLYGPSVPQGPSMHDQGPAQVLDNTRQASSSSNEMDRFGTTIGDEEFLDMDDDEERGEDGGRQQSSTALEKKKKDKPRAAAEDFPMPPSHAPVPFPHQPKASMPSVIDTNVPTQARPQPSAQHAAEMVHRQPHTHVVQSQSSLEPGPSTPVPESPLPDSYLSPTQVAHGYSSAGPSLTFRALPLIPDDLRTTRVTVSHSSIKANDRGKDVLSFVIEVDPGNSKEGWKVEKLYSDVLGLDHRLRAAVGKGVVKKMGVLPEGRLWRDHAPAKADQRKVALEVYLQSLLTLPVKNKDEVIAFFTSDIVRDANKPVMQAGYKEGYLTKRGKNFGGWKTRYFVLQGPVLEYYESRGGAHLGSIVITNSQIGRQQRSNDSDDERNYRHAFLIIEAKKGPGGSNPRHVLCAESDTERDSWVDILVRYVTGTFNDDALSSTSAGQSMGSGQPRSSTSSNQDGLNTSNTKRGMRAMSKDDISRGTAVPISQLAPDANNAKFFQTAPRPGSNPVDDFHSSPTKSTHTSPPMSSSLPTTSPLDAAGQGLVSFRAKSELGHYPDMDRCGVYPKQEPMTPEPNRIREQRRDRKSYHPGLSAVSGSPTATTFPERASSPDINSTPVRGGDPNNKVKISGPLSGAPIPAGYKFGGKDASAEGTPSDRREKAKSRSFWNFGRPMDKSTVSAPRAVFGVPLDESLEVAEIARLPAVVFRCIQYLEAKKAEQEEGIYRLSGSSAVIKGLKDRFNAEGDVDLLTSDEYWDPHAIAGLLKSYFRELPASILTRELHMKFLAVMDFVEPQERIRELSFLIASLPIANYSLLRALTAHLILIVQNAAANKMTMRNVGIVFSPTLGIPAGVFSLMLGEFNRVFNVDAEDKGELSRRNSRQYSDAAADQLLGLSGRTLHAPVEDTPSEDGDSISIQYESGNETTENDATVESSQTRSSNNPSQYHSIQQATEFLSPARADVPALEHRSRASSVAASRGLNVAVSRKANRQSRMMGLPASPRPPVESPQSPVPSPMQTAKQS